MKTKAIISILVVLTLCFALVGCGKGIKKDEAKELTEAFTESVENGDFEKAKTYFHPERPLDVEKYFNNKEVEYGVDFQKGIEITKYTEYSSSLYDSEVDGSDYELEANITVDGVALEISVEIVKNDRGYGIYEIEIDR